MKLSLVIGTRASPLALWQAEFVKAELEKNFPHLDVSLQRIKTTGDRILDTPLSQIGDKGLFTREIEKELLAGTIDLAVHSLKDLPTRTPDGLTIAAITRREDPHDVLIAKAAKSIRSLPPNARVATGSLRRRAQLLHLRPDLEIMEIRGNVGTRFKKFDAENLDAMILAYAGVHRLGYDTRIANTIAFDEMLPAVGQGALGLETRAGDAETISMLAVLNDNDTALCTAAERSLLRRLEGGCQVPIGANAEIKNETLTLTAVIASLDGKQFIRAAHADDAKNIIDAEAIGLALAETLWQQGGEHILENIRTL